ncbi:MAG: hypothetical protein KJ061_00060 [Vicinamibacteraceae bacterium]|nr:hypothetical protein [Vicinamibacteraceae bacterium]
MTRSAARRVVAFATLLPMWLLPHATASAQPGVSLDIGQQFDNVSGLGTLEDTARQLAVSFDAEHVFAAERARIFYGVDVSDYAVDGDWRTVNHGVGGTYRIDLGARQRASLFLGGDATLRRNGDAWAAANFNGAGAFANLELRPRPTMTVRTGYRFDVRRFDELGALDQDEHSGFVSLLVNLQTRTTIIGEASVGRRAYDGVPPTSSWIATITPAAPTPAPGPGGMGKGVGGPGTGRFIVGREMVLDPGSPAARATRVTLFARVAQSLADRVAVSADVSRRLTGGDVPPAVIETPARFFDDGIYDDAYASDMTLGRLGVRAMLGAGLQLDVSGFAEEKDYTATVARDAEGLPLPDGTPRADTVYQGVVSLRIPIVPTRTGGWEVAVVTRYDYTRYRSTDAFYRYTSHAAGVGLSLSY